MPRITKPQATSKQFYTVLIEPGSQRINGARCAKGDVIELSEPQARFLLLDGVIELTAAAPAKSSPAASEPQA